MTSRSMLGIAGVIGGLTVTGATVIGYRWRQLELVRAALNKEYVGILKDLRTIEETRLSEANELRRKRENVKLMHETVDAIWLDRFARYKQTNKELFSYLKALPEALGILKGMTSHYEYMATEMRKFVTFDVACCKVHSLGLLLEQGDHVGLHRVANTIKQLLISEPLVEVVCKNIADVNLDTVCPSSIGESSETFVFCMGELDRAMEGAVRRYWELHQFGHVEKAPNVLCQLAHKLINEAKVNPVSRTIMMMQGERKALRDQLVRERRQLRTVEDLASAVKYVEDVSNVLHQSRTGSGNLPDAVATNSAVDAARKQLLLWRRSAAIFLVQQQAKEALRAYHLLLEETLTKTSSKRERVA